CARSDYYGSSPFAYW
nr:immunoglobulin heavy chain junction region [Mus musculus]